MPREIIITTNLFVIICTVGCLCYLLYATSKYMNWSHPRKPKKKDLYNYYWDNSNRCWCKYKKVNTPENNNPKYWYPTGWYWDDEKKCWQPPDYIDQDK